MCRRDLAGCRCLQVGSALIPERAIPEPKIGTENAWRSPEGSATTPQYRGNDLLTIMLRFALLPDGPAPLSKHCGRGFCDGALCLAATSNSAEHERAAEMRAVRIYPPAPGLPARRHLQ